MPKIYYESKPGELEHGLFGSTKPRANTKYIHKIDLGNGKYRYFYTQQELDAYNAMRKLGKGVKNAVANVNEKISDAMGKRYYDDAAEAAKERTKQNNAYIDASKRTKTAQSDVARYGKAYEEYGQSGHKMQQNLARERKAMAEQDAKNATLASKAANERYNESKAKGDASLYGKIQSAKKKAKKAADDISKKVKKTAANVNEKISDAMGKQYYDDAAEAAKERTKQNNAYLDASKKAKTADSKVKSYGNSIEKISGSNSRYKNDTVQSLKNAQKTYREAKVMEEQAARTASQKSAEANKRYNELTEKGNKSLYGLIQAAKKKAKAKKKKK